MIWKTPEKPSKCPFAMDKRRVEELFRTALGLIPQFNPITAAVRCQPIPSVSGQ
jgi:hypothetical protein